ncbi:hypothetical protein HPY42_04680 [Coprothermobacteraceae bacterium]|nr:hypothetical protein [Coprothermobacteraceae bacterium]
MLTRVKGQLYEQEGLYWLKIGDIFSLQVLKCTPSSGVGEYLLYISFENDVHALVFANMEEYRFFERLRNVRGVGNTKASRLLSLFGLDTLRAMLASSDVEHLAQLPGIGTKTARRLVAELLDVTETQAQDDSEAAQEILEALRDLGYDARRGAEVLKRSDQWRSLNLDEALRWIIETLNSSQVNDV